MNVLRFVCDLIKAIDQHNVSYSYSYSLQYTGQLTLSSFLITADSLHCIYVSYCLLCVKYFYTNDVSGASSTPVFTRLDAAQ
jgi:hypothetical protein